MNLTTISQAVLTMTTREVADLIEKPHSNIKISAERLSEKGVIGTLAMQEFEHNGNIYTTYVLNKRDSLILVAQNCPEFTARIVDRWQELESQQPKFDPANLSRMDILKLAIESEEGRIKAEAEVLSLTHVIEAQKPAVEFVDRFVEAKSAKGFREVAKILGVKEREFIESLAADKIIFKQGSNWLPMAHHQHSGRFTVKVGESNGHSFHQTRFTPEGIAWVAKRYSNML